MIKEYRYIGQTFTNAMVKKWVKKLHKMHATDKINADKLRREIRHLSIIAERDEEDLWEIYDSI